MQFINIFLTFLTFFIFNLDTSTEVNEEQPKKVPAICLSKEVSKFKNLISVILGHLQNKQRVELRGVFQTNLTVLPDEFIFILVQSVKFWISSLRNINVGHGNSVLRYLSYSIELIPILFIFKIISEEFNEKLSW